MNVKIAEKTVPVHETVDILVIGDGPARIGAAVAASRQGQRVKMYRPIVSAANTLTRVFLDAFMLKEGVNVKQHAFVNDVIRTGSKIDCVVIQTKQGPRAIRAKMVIDATGDGDVAFSAGKTSITCERQWIGFGRMHPDNTGNSGYGLTGGERPMES